MDWEYPSNLSSHFKTLLNSNMLFTVSANSFHSSIDIIPENFELKGNISKIQGKSSSNLEDIEETDHVMLRKYLHDTTSVKLTESARLFKNDQSLFYQYHKGFITQRSKWPLNPLMKIISIINSIPIHCVVADMGCGDALLSKFVTRHKVHSFDFISLNSNVTPCDMRSVPLQKNSVDIVVFCLSLMGTNISDFIAEGYRILNESGLFLIADITSRFQSIPEFVRKMEKFGLVLNTTEYLNNIFVLLHFTKVKTFALKFPKIKMNPCYYKKK